MSELQFHPPPSPKVILRRFQGSDMTLCVYDYDISMAAPSIVQEVCRDEYCLNRIPFQDGDCVIDIGGHVGIISIYLAKKFPFLKIYAYEPMAQNFECFRKNILANKVTNVFAHHLAVTSDGRDLEFNYNPVNTGGATTHTRAPINAKAKSVTLQEIFDTHKIRSCKLLKIDCEGSEHEILLNTDLLKRVEYLSAEFHINTHLEEKGYSIEKLYKHCRRYIQPDKIFVVPLRMCE